MKKIYILFLCFFIVQGVNAQVCFQPPAYYTVSGSPVNNNSLNADFNNDGNIDLAVVNGIKVSILLGSNTGVFSAPIDNALLTSFTAMTAADFNNDSNTDIVGIYWNASGAPTFGVCLGDGTGHFVNSSFMGVGGDYAITCADFNKDHKMDFATSNNGNPNLITVYTGHGDGTFSASNLTVGNPASTFINIASADLNADGFVDIVSIAQRAPAGDLVVMINDGTGNFLTPTIYTLPDLPLFLLLDDFTKDGNIDILYTINNAGASSASNGIYVSPGNGSGAFSTPIKTSVSNPSRFVTADFDGDTNLDLAYCTNNYGAIDAVSVFWGNGAGAFVPSQANFYYNTNATPYGLLTADYNKDNIPDIAVVENTTSNNISVIMGSRAMSSFLITTTPISCPGASDGMVAVAVTGSGAPFQYYWNNGQTTDTIKNIGVTFIHSITVTASDGCKALQDVTISQPISVSSVFTILNTTCGSGALLDLNATVSGGTPPLTYQWSTAPTQTTTLASNLGPGIYTLTITDAHSCITTFTNNVGPVAKLTPAVLYHNPVVSASRMISADFNKDGMADLATCNDNDGNVSIMLGSGGGNFGSVVKYSFGGGGNGLFPSSLLANDFNGDGNLDLVTLPDNTIRILLGTGTGAFLTPTSINLGGVYTNEGVAADFNKDGNMDIAIYQDQSSKIRIYNGNGNNQFTLTNTFSVTTTQYTQAGMATADLNVDGFADIVTLAGSKLIVLLGGNNGVFSSPVYYPGLSGCESVNIADMNEDGHLDIVAIINSHCSIYTGDGIGAFNNPVGYTLAAFANTNSYGAVADFNGDGHKDVVATNSVGNKFAIACGDGTGHLYLATETLVHGNGYGVCAADFDGDGQCDIAVASIDSANVNMFLNCQITGISTEKQNQNIKIYPNPSTGEFTINTNTEEKQQLKIYDVTGKLILSKNISGNTSFNMPDLQNGVYTVILKSAQQVYTSKFILVN